MATEEVTKELGELNLEGEAPPATDVPTEEAKEEKEATLEELTDSPPELHHVETADTIDPSSELAAGGDVVKAEVPAAFEEELKSDHDIVPPKEETPPEEAPKTTVETTATETGPESGDTTPTTTEVPTEVTHEDVDTKPPSKISSFGDKISSAFHKIAGKD